MLIEKRITGITFLMAICALGTCFAWFCASYWIVFNGFGGLSLRSPASVDSYYATLGLIMLGIVVDYLRTNTSRVYDLHGYNKWGFSFFAASQQSATLLILLSLYMALAKDQSVSRLFLTWFLAGLIPVLTLIHRLVPQWLAKHLFGGRYMYQAVIVSGAKAGQERVSAWLAKQQRYGVNAQESIDLGDFALNDHQASEKVMEKLTFELKKRQPAMIIMHQFPVDSDTLLKL